LGLYCWALLFFIYFWWIITGSNELQAFKQKKEDSIRRVNGQYKTCGYHAARVDSLKRDSAQRVSSAGDFTTAALGAEQLVN
jgi:YidC/Oxa1 family membrane protein insertase